MNDGDTILARQEIEGNKRKLAAQRQIYTVAKRVLLAEFVCCLVVPLVVTGFQLFCAIEFWFIAVMSILMSLAGAALRLWAVSLAEKAAGVQQGFDSDVFGVPFENVVDDERTVSNYHRKYLKKHKDMSEFNVWYTAPLEGLEPAAAVKACQRQNAAWTSGLEGRYLALVTLLSIALAALLVLAVEKSGIPASNVAFLLPILEWLLLNIASGIRSCYKAGKLAKDLDHYPLVPMEGAQCVQNDIYKSRKSSFLVPNYFYSIWKKHDDARTSV